MAAKDSKDVCRIASASLRLVARARGPLTFGAVCGQVKTVNVSKDGGKSSAASSSSAAAGGGGGGQKKASLADKKVFDDASLFDSSEDIKAVPSFEGMGLKED